MIIAIFSDTHDNVDAFTWALKTAQARGAVHGIHCGDLTSDIIVRVMMFAPFPIFAVCGNNDIHKADELTGLASGSTCTLVPHMEGALTLDGQKIFTCHYPDVAQRAASSGQYDVVFHGHTHIAAASHVNNTLLVNPGELQGRFGKLSFALYDTQARTLEHIFKD